MHKFATEIVLKPHQRKYVRWFNQYNLKLDDNDQLSSDDSDFVYVENVDECKESQNE